MSPCACGSVLKPRLAAERRATVYETLERPLVDVLARMEMRGILVDRQILSRLSGDFAQTLARLEDEIQEMAGEKFALGSPKQIGDILFGKMGLPGAKKTPSGQWATPATLLDELAQAGHELPAKDSRMAPALEAEIDLYRHAAAAHASGDQAGAHLVRARRDHDGASLLVRSEPAEHPDPHGSRPQDPHAPSSRRKGTKIISADYSQIELRLLAHIADIPQLQEAFAQWPSTFTRRPPRPCSACRSTG